MEDQTFSFLLYRSPEDGLVFVAIDSIAGYIKSIARDIELYSVDPSSGLLSVALKMLAESIEEIDSGRPN